MWSTISKWFGLIYDEEEEEAGDIPDHIRATAGSQGIKEIRKEREWREFDGVVTSLHSSYGLIDFEVFFTHDVVSDGVMPQLGDKVHVKASREHKVGGWKADLVCHLTSKLWDDDDATDEEFEDKTDAADEDECEEKCKAKLKRAKRLREKQAKKAALLEELLADKNDINITYPVNFGDMEIGKTKSLKLEIRNGGPAGQLLYGWSLDSTSGSSQFEFSPIRLLSIDLKESSRKAQEALPMILEAGKTAVITVYCNARYLGLDEQMIVFEFDGFKIGRKIKVMICDSSQLDLQPTAPYQKSQATGRYQLTKDSWIIPGQRPNWSGIKSFKRLAQFPIPESLRKCILEQRDVTCLAPVLNKPLSPENYAGRFSALLFLEEIQQEIDIREFDLEHAKMYHRGEFLSLQVPGLAEGRPSLLIGDRVILSVAEKSVLAPSYEGIIHEVLKDEILLKFCDEFHTKYNGEEYNVRFMFGRTNFRRCHAAADYASKLKTGILFPKSLEVKSPQNQPAPGSPQNSTAQVVAAKPATGIRRCPSRPQPKVHAGHTFFNETLNARQRSAVFRVLQGQSRPIPYVIYGPPGTGKTVTVVECILQIFFNMPRSCILACTPSNSASDLLTERLHQSGLIHVTDVVRMNAYQRDLDNVAECIRPYCSDINSPALIKTRRITICTCSTAGSFYAMELPTNHFTHVFVDEAGQATEPECMIPVCLVAASAGQVILAGDPLQLGPVLRSNLAKDYGLQVSYLERLSILPLYKRDPSKFVCHGAYDPLLVTKLVENYRSHPALLNLSSELFYDNELVISAEKHLIDCLCGWEHLPNKNSFPVLFHGIRGEDLREGNSPSWFNPQEAVQVMKYLQSIVNNEFYRLTYDDVGIITPYRKQVEKIRLLIDRLGMDKVKVGSVEEFQGQERLVMIISTVRSTESLVSVDLRYTLGFLSNPKRFNVAITRAHALLVIVGNPHVLCQDFYWSKLLQYCVRNGAYLGCDLPNLSVDDGSHECQAMSNDGIQSETDLKQDDIALKQSESSNIVNTYSTDLAGDVSLCNEREVSESVYEAVLEGDDCSAPDVKNIDEVQSSGISTQVNEAGDHLLHESDPCSPFICTPSSDETNVGTGLMGDGDNGSSGNSLNCASMEDTNADVDDHVISAELQHANHHTVLPVENCHLDESLQNHSDVISGLEDADTFIKEPKFDCSINEDNEYNGTSHLHGSHLSVIPAFETCTELSSYNPNDIAGTIGSPSNLFEQNVDSAVVNKTIVKVSTSDSSSHVEYLPNSSCENSMSDCLSLLKNSVEDGSDATASDLFILLDAKTCPGSESGKPEIRNSELTSCVSQETGNEGCEEEKLNSGDVLLPKVTEDPIFSLSSRENPNVPGIADESESCLAATTVLDGVGDRGLRRDDKSVAVESMALSSSAYSTSANRRGSSEQHSAPKLSSRSWDGENLDAGQDSRFKGASNYRGRRMGNKDCSGYSFQNSDRGRGRGRGGGRGGHSRRGFRTGIKMDNDVMFSIPDSTANLRKSPDRIFGKFKSALEEPEPGDNLSRKCSVEGENRGEGQKSLLSQARSDIATEIAEDHPAVAEESKTFSYRRSRQPIENILDLSKDKIVDTAEQDSFTDLERKIVRQMEYYFGDVNLMRDAFLKEQIARDPDGWVELSVIVTFNRMKALSTDFKAICDALKKSSVQIIEINEDDTKVRRSVSKPLNTNLESWLMDLKNRAAVIKKYPNSESVENMQAFFETFGVVAHIERGISKQWRQSNGRCGLEMVDLVIFVSPDSVRDLAKRRFTTLKRMGLFAHFGDDVTSQCVDYFYRRRILGVPRQSLNPVSDGFNNIGSRSYAPKTTSLPPFKQSAQKGVSEQGNDSNDTNKCETSVSVSDDKTITASEESKFSLGEAADGESNHRHRTTWKRQPQSDVARHSWRLEFSDSRRRPWRSGGAKKETEVDRLLSSMDNISFSRQDAVSPCPSSDSVLWSSLESSPTKTASGRNSSSNFSRPNFDVERSFEPSLGLSNAERDLLEVADRPLLSHRSRKVKCFVLDSFEPGECPLPEQSSGEGAESTAADNVSCRDLPVPSSARGIPEMNLDCLKGGATSEFDAVHEVFLQATQIRDRSFGKTSSLENSVSSERKPLEAINTGKTSRFDDPTHQEHEPANVNVSALHDSENPTAPNDRSYRTTSLYQEDDDIIIESSCEEILEDDDSEEEVGGWD